MEKKNTVWCIQASKTLDILLEKAVEKGTFSSKSDLVRSSVRNTLKEMGLTQEKSPKTEKSQ